MLFATMAMGAQNLNRIDGSNPTNEPDKPRKYLFFSAGLDPKNAIWGGKELDSQERRNKAAIDLFIRTGFGFETERFGTWEIGITGEFFDAIDYKSVGLDANYVFEISRTQMVIFGGEGVFIFREGLNNVPKNKKDSFTHYAPAINLRYRAEAILGTPFFAEAHLRYIYRTDIGYFWGADEIPPINEMKSYSGYISIGIKF